LGPFIHGRLKNLKTSEDTFDHDITPLNEWVLVNILTISKSDFMSKQFALLMPIDQRFGKWKKNKERIIIVVYTSSGQKLPGN